MGTVLMKKRQFYQSAGLLAVLLLATSCQLFSFMDEVQKDKRDVYKSSQSLPDLEVPPDLVLESAVDALHVDEQSAADEGGAVSSDTQPSDEQEQASEEQPSDEREQAPLNSMEVAAGVSELWPVLVDFFINKGWVLAVSDKDLGVIETEWSAPYFQEKQTVRDRFKVFMEVTSPTVTRLVLTSEKEAFQQSEEGHADGSWVVISDQEVIDTYNQGTIREMETFFRDKLESAFSSEGV